MMTGANLPIILLPGMGADERLFRQQRKAFEQLIVPGWIAPLPRESLGDYARRLAAHVDPGEPCIVGGASFGGFVAMEMCHALDTRACILIGSARSPAEFPPMLRLTMKASAMTRLVPFEAAVSVASQQAVLSRFLSPATNRFLRQLASARGAFLRWASEAVLTWRPTPTPVPVFHIHGGRDRVLPIRYVQPDETIAVGGHVISMTHGDAVNAFMRRCIGQVEKSSD